MRTQANPSMGENNDTVTGKMYVRGPFLNAT